MATRKKARRRTRAEELVELSQNADVNRLANLMQDCERLRRDCERIRVMIRQYRHDHHVRCRCRCCAHIRKFNGSFPNFFDYLTVIETAIWSASCVAEERPLGRVDFEELRAEGLA